MKRFFLSVLCTDTVSENSDICTTFDLNCFRLAWTSTSSILLFLFHLAAKTTRIVHRTMKNYQKIPEIQIFSRILYEFD